MSNGSMLPASAYDIEIWEDLRSYLYYNNNNKKKAEKYAKLQLNLNPSEIRVMNCSEGSEEMGHEHLDS